MFTVEEPDEIIKKLKEYFGSQQYSIKESSKKFKLQARCPISEDEVLMNIKVEKMDEDVRCIRAEKVYGAKMDFLTIFNEVKSHLTDAEMLL